MAGKTKTRSIQYKRAVFSDPHIKLQTLLIAALKAKVKEARLRQESFTDDEGTFRLINKNADFSGMLCGQFIAYEPGKRQPWLRLDDKAEFYTIAVTDPAADGAFADDTFYFAIHENDIACASTRGLRAREFETHLAWLLTTCTDLVQPDVTLMLSDQPAPEVYNRARMAPVRSIRIGTPVFSALEESHEPGLSAGNERRRFKPVGRAADILSSMIGVDGFNKLLFENDLDEANLHVTVEVSFKRKTTDDGQGLINSVAQAFRHFEGEDFELKLQGKGVIKGKELKLSKPVSVKFLESGLPDENDLFKAMHDWLIGILLAQT